MQVIQRGLLKDNTKMQIEDWSKDYSFYNYGCTLATYPKSKANQKGQFAPKSGEVYRFDFQFNSFEETEKAFKELIDNKKILGDFKDKLRDKKYLDCI
jgi:hypothetical protein